MEPVTFVVYALGFIALLVLTQDVHIFPGAYLSKVKSFFFPPQNIPPLVDAQFIQSKDGATLEVWCYQPETKADLSDYVAIICHGNGGTLENFVFVQMWLAELGIRSYSFDYRGFGNSKGWPNERGLYIDSEAVWAHVIRENGIEASKIIVIGISLGSALAARLAALYAPKLLVLSSAFTDLRSTVRAQPLIGLLWPLVRYEFPTREFIGNLGVTDLLLAHGSKDRIVPASHSKALEKAYRGSGRVRRLESDNAGHNMAFYALKDSLKTTLKQWL